VTQGEKTRTRTLKENLFCNLQWTLPAFLVFFVIWDTQFRRFTNIARQPCLLRYNKQVIVRCVGTPTYHSISYSIPFHLTALLPLSVHQPTHRPNQREAVHRKEVTTAHREGSLARQEAWLPGHDALWTWHTTAHLGHPAAAHQNQSQAPQFHHGPPVNQPCDQRFIINRGPQMHLKIDTYCIIL